MTNLLCSEDGADPREKYPDLDSQSALHAAAAIGSLAIVHVLIQVNMGIHSRTGEHTLPILVKEMCAC